MPKLVARLARRSTIVGLPPSAVPNFAKSLIVVARRGFSDAARRSIVSLSERSFFARAPLGCDVFRGRERDVRDESASVCLGGAGRQCIEAVLPLATEEVRGRLVVMLDGRPLVTQPSPCSRRGSGDAAWGRRSALGANVPVTVQ